MYALALGGAADIAVFEAAKKGGFVLVTKDDDFHTLSVFRGHPPKVVWVRLGNSTVADTVDFFKSRQRVIGAFARDEEAGFLALG